MCFIKDAGIGVDERIGAAVEAPDESGARVYRF